LQKNANKVKSDSGQYGTLRPRVCVMVEVTKPQPNEVLQDPWAGTADTTGIGAKNTARSCSTAFVRTAAV